MEVQATRPSLTLQNHKQTGGDNAKHRDKKGERNGEKGAKEGKRIIVFEHFLFSPHSLKHYKVQSI